MLRGVIGAKAGAADCHALTIAFAAREIEHVADDHIFIGVVCAHPVGWMNRFVVKTFQIDRVRAINRHPAGIDIAATDPTRPKSLF